MSEDLCCICKKRKPDIRIEGVGDFCLECHNARMLKKFELDDSFQYSDQFLVREADGTIHAFKIEHIILGDLVSWNANEQGGNYQFHQLTDVTQNGAEAAQRFFKKITDGVCSKTLSESNVPVMNLAEKDGKYWGLREKGTINIVEDPNNIHAVLFEIDGMIFTSEEFGKLCGGLPGFMMQFQIHDASEPILSENEFLIPTRISKQSLLDELMSTLAAVTDKGYFLSYKAVPIFDESFFQIIEKLKILYRSEKRDDAVEAGRDMARTLAKIEHDDDWFPQYEFQCIRETIDPYDQDEILRNIIQEWEDNL